MPRLDQNPIVQAADRRRRGVRHGAWAVVIVGVLVASVSTPKPAHAATWWWNSLTTGLWTNGANWSNAASGGTTGTAPTNDTTTDVVVFNTTGTNGAVVAQLSQDQSIGGITVNNTGATTVQSSTSTTLTFTLGAGGITINSGAGAFTIGETGDPLPNTLAMQLFCRPGIKHGVA